VKIRELFAANRWTSLDLIDSLLFTAPLLFFYLRLVIRVSVENF